MVPLTLTVRLRRRFAATLMDSVGTTDQESSDVSTLMRATAFDITSSTLLDTNNVTNSRVSMVNVSVSHPVETFDSSTTMDPENATELSITTAAAMTAIPTKPVKLRQLDHRSAGQRSGHHGGRLSKSRAKHYSDGRVDDIRKLELDSDSSIGNFTDVQNATLTSDLDSSMVIESENSTVVPPGVEVWTSPEDLPTGHSTSGTSETQGLDVSDTATAGLLLLES